MKTVALFLGLALVAAILVIVTGQVNAASTTSNVSVPQSQTYDCYRPPVLHCDLVANQFTTKSLYGVFQNIYGVTSPFEPVKGVNGTNALSIKGHVGEYVTIPNSPSLNPDKFTVSFWVKRAFGYGLDGAILSHVNGERTSGWFIKSIIMTGHAAKIQFSVVNTDGEIFTVENPLNNGSEFEEVVAQFDGSNVKLSVNNSSTSNSTAFKGTYQPDPDVPFNLGRLGQDVWKGTIDELRFGPSYWSFDNDTKDISGNGNDGRLASLVVSMAFSPDGRLFFSEKNTGLIRIMKDDKVLAEPFVKVQTEFAEHQGLLGITVDPKFSSNHFIYAYYTQVDNKTKTPYNRVVRFTESNNVSVSEKILLDNITASMNGEFAGGALAFGKGEDDNLYITVGYANIFKLAQNMSSLAGKVLRITRDGTIPPDNPFPNSPIFTLGHRSQFGITFNNAGIGFITDNGDKHYDEINQLQSGGNYGFPTTQQLNSPPELDDINIRPIRSYWNDLSPTQAIFYHLSKNQNLNTNLNDKLLFGSYNKGKLIALGLDSTTTTTTVPSKVRDETEIHFPKMTDNIIAIAESPTTGDIYFGGYNIYKLTSVQVPPVQRLQHQQMDFVTFTGSKVKNLDLSNTSLSLTLDNDTDTKTKTKTNTIDAKIPNKVLHGIFKVQGDDVKDFKIGQFSSGSGRITNQSSTTVHIDLNPNGLNKKTGVITINGTK